MKKGVIVFVVILVVSLVFIGGNSSVSQVLWGNSENWAGQGWFDRGNLVGQATHSTIKAGHIFKNQNGRYYRVMDGGKGVNGGNEYTVRQCKPPNCRTVHSRDFDYLLPHGETLNVFWRESPTFHISNNIVVTGAPPSPSEEAHVPDDEEAAPTPSAPRETTTAEDWNKLDVNKAQKVKFANALAAIENREDSGLTDALIAKVRSGDIAAIKEAQEIIGFTGAQVDGKPGIGTLNQVQAFKGEARQAAPAVLFPPEERRVAVLDLNKADAELRIIAGQERLLGVEVDKQNDLILYQQWLEGDRLTPYEGAKTNVVKEFGYEIPEEGDLEARKNLVAAKLKGVNEKIAELNSATSSEKINELRERKAELTGLIEAHDAYHSRIILERGNTPDSGAVASQFGFNEEASLDSTGDVRSYKRGDGTLLHFYPDGSVRKSKGAGDETTDYDSYHEFMADELGFDLNSKRDAGDGGVTAGASTFYYRDNDGDGKPDDTLLFSSGRTQVLRGDGGTPFYIVEYDKNGRATFKPNENFDNADSIPPEILKSMKKDGLLTEEEHVAATKKDNPTSTEAIKALVKKKAKEKEEESKKKAGEKSIATKADTRLTDLKSAREAAKNELLSGEAGNAELATIEDEVANLIAEQEDARVNDEDFDVGDRLDQMEEDKDITSEQRRDIERLLSLGGSRFQSDESKADITRFKQAIVARKNMETAGADFNEKRKVRKDAEKEHRTAVKAATKAKKDNADEIRRKEAEVAKIKVELAELEKAGSSSGEGEDADGKITAAQTKLAEAQKQLDELTGDDKVKETEKAIEDATEEEKTAREKQRALVRENERLQENAHVIRRSIGAGEVFGNAVVESGKYNALSMALFGDLYAKELASDIDRWFSNTVLDASFYSSYICRDQLEGPDDVQKNGAALIESPSGTVQAVANIQAQRSSSKFPLLCTANEEGEPECTGDLECREDQFCYNENSDTPEDGYQYTITWGVRAPQDEKSTPYLDENGIAVEFNIWLDTHKIYPKNIELKNGALDNAKLVWYSNKDFLDKEACIKWSKPPVTRGGGFGGGREVGDVCFTVQTTAKGIVRNEVAEQTETVSGGQIQPNLP